MPIKILMPALSPTMEKGNLAKWHVGEGDTVKSGDIIAEIETDKAVMEVESIEDGRIGRIFVPEGTADVPVNQLIAMLLAEGEDDSAITNPESYDVPPDAPQHMDQVSHDTPSNVTPDRSSGASQDSGASQEGASSSATGRTPPSDHPLPSHDNAAPSSHQETRLFVSPLARRMAKERNIKLETVQGSGPHGRIIMRDIEQAALTASSRDVTVQSATSKPLPATGGGVPGMTDTQIKALYAPDSYEEIPHDGMRQTIARRLTLSKQTVPHFYLTVDCELDAMLKLRTQINEAAPVDDARIPAYKLSVNDFVIKALALALRAIPTANATWTDSGTLLHKHADVGVAVAVPGGLFTPIIRKAEQKSLSTISLEMKDFAARARSRTLRPDEYEGGVTSVSNLGMYGIKEFKAVINPPHGTILAVGAGEQRAVIRDGRVVVAHMMTVTLSCDHRIIDGSVGADLLRSFQDLIQHPMRMLA